MEIKNILCEYLKNPIGIGILNPRITWDLEGIKKGISEKKRNSNIKCVDQRKHHTILF